MAYGAYDKHVLDAAVVDGALATGINLSAALNAVAFIKTVNEPVTVTRFGFRPTTVFTYGTGPTIGILTLWRYPVAGGSGAVALATINLEDAAAVNNVYYVDVPNPAVPPTKVNGVITVRGRNKADIDAGEQIVVTVSLAAVGGTKTGVYQAYVAYHPRAEVEDNQSKMHNRTP